jgi:hypothetical protein
MHRLPRYLIALALLAAAGAAAAGVTVTYQEPEKFIDVPQSDQDRAQVLNELTRHFEKLAQQLPPGQNLTITVTDIDLAGRVEPRRRSMQDIRILRGGADWPAMELSYTLEQDGKVLRAGKEHLSNMDYQHRMGRYHNDDYLRYEKQMVDDWFRQQFLPSRVSSK